MRVAKVLLYDDAKHALVLRRSGTHPVFAYEPDLPGGIIEPGERYEDGLVREIKEETGIDILPSELRLKAVRNRFGHANKRLYEAHLTERPELTISWEHDQFEWVAGKALAGKLTSHDSYMAFAQDIVTHDA